MAQSVRDKIRRAGQATIEFAFSAMILLLLFFGVIELAEVSRTIAAIQHAARVGARFAGTHPACTNNSDEITQHQDAIKEVVQNQLVGLANAADARVTFKSFPQDNPTDKNIDWAHPVDGIGLTGDAVEVMVSYPVTWSAMKFLAYGASTGVQELHFYEIGINEGRCNTSPTLPGQGPT